MKRSSHLQKTKRQKSGEDCAGKAASQDHPQLNLELKPGCGETHFFINSDSGSESK